MTCIVALIENRKVIIGGDSAGVAGYDIELRKDPKVFKRGKMVFGFTSSFRMGQLLMTSLKIPAHKKGKDSFEYMCTDFIDAVRECFNKGGYKQVLNSVESGGQFIVGYKGKIYNIDNDFQVGVPKENFTACGCGTQIALGSLYTSKGRNAHHRVRQALKAAESFSAGVKGPFKIIEED